MVWYGHFCKNIKSLCISLSNHEAMMAVNEKEVPSGHFHDHACKDGNEVEGKRNMTDYEVELDSEQSGE